MDPSFDWISSFFMSLHTFTCGFLACAQGQSCKFVGDAIDFSKGGGSLKRRRFYRRGELPLWRGCRKFQKSFSEISKVSNNWPILFYLHYQQVAVVGATVLMVNPAFAATIKLGGDTGTRFLPVVRHGLQGRNRWIRQQQGVPAQRRLRWRRRPGWGRCRQDLPRGLWAQGRRSRTSLTPRYLRLLRTAPRRACKARSSSTKFINYIRL